MPRDDRFDLDVLSQRVVFGVGRVDEVPAEVERLGLHRLLVVSTGSAKYTADDLCDVLGAAVAARITGVLQHVPEAEASEAVRLTTANDADGVLTIGGGSATGLGKAVAVSTGLPVLSVPTTYAGSEATSTYGITGAHKRTGRDARALPRIVVYDPALTTGMPARLTAASGMNAMAHCVEALYAKGGDPITSSLAQEGIRRLASALPQATQNPAYLAVRSEALLGAHLAGWAMEHAGTALHHTLCHVIGGTYRVDHAEVHAVLLPYVAAYNSAAAPEALAQVAHALGATDAAHGLRSLAETLHTPTDLASLGVPGDGLDQVVEAALLAVGGRNPRRPDTPSLRRLLDDAYAGRPPGQY
jgi:alcohol dehydrogenase class IV